MIRWSASEDAIMLKEFPIGGYKAVKHLLPSRSEQAIRTRATFLGIRAKLTQDDKRLIVTLYPSLTKQSIADKFGVHVHTIYKVLRNHELHV